MRVRSPRGIAAAVLFAAVWLVATNVGADTVARDTPGDVGNRGRDGRRAALALLQRLGRDAVAWRSPPYRLAELAPARRTAAAPPAGRAEAGSETDDAPVLLTARPPALGAAEVGPSGFLRDPRAYRAFVESGGVWIVPYTAAFETFLAKDLGIAGLDRAPRRAPAEGELAVRLAGDGDGAPLRVEPGRAGVFAARAPEDPTLGGRAFEVLAGAADGRAIALATPLGRGRLVLLSSDAFLSNAALGELDHGVLFVHLVEALSARGPILFDQFALGDQVHTTAASVALGPDARWTSAAWILAALVAAWRFATPGAFARAEAAASHTAPLERVRGRASLLLRAGRADRLASDLAEALGGEARARASARLAASPVRSARELEAFARELDALERELDGHALDRDTRTRERERAGAEAERRPAPSDTRHDP